MSDPREKRIEHFVVHGDGTVTDTRTALMWMCDRQLARLSLNDAMAIRRDFAGCVDWRLPTISELKSVVPLDARVFPKYEEGYVWSSTEYHSSGSQQDGWYWIITPKGTIGFGHPETGREHVRLVRSPRAFTLGVARIGSGNGTVTGKFQDGTITRNPEAERYLDGHTITLSAHAAEGSTFKRWHGDASGSSVVCTVKFDSQKKVSAEFEQPEWFSLIVTSSGLGAGTVATKLESGKVNRSQKGESYIDGSTVSLVAHAFAGSTFKRWHGDASGLSKPSCTVTINSPKTISAEFVRLASFPLEIKTTGTGQGTISRSIKADKYFAGSNVTLIAYAATGSVFSGWQGDAIGADGVCTVTIDSAKVITAKFDQLDIPDLGVGVTYDSIEDADLANGDKAVVLYLTFTNHAEKQAQIEIPLSICATGNGEEVEQSVWLPGLVTGSKICTIRAGAFRKMGLVFLKSKLTNVSTGDHLLVTVNQKKPSRRLHFTFKCTHQEARSFTLVNATAEDVQAPEETIAMFEILRRLVLMEEGLSDMRRKFDGLQTAPSAVKAINRKPPENTLKEVVAWLATQDRIAVATLRIHLLPLDLLPTAVIDKLNERALDLTGELALEELGDEIVVTREVLDEVIANWDSRER